MQPETLKTWVKGKPSSYQLRDVTHFPDWGELIVLDAFFNNLASAFVICICLAWGLQGAFFGPIVPLALTVALALLIIDLCLLVADLGDSKRFFHSLRVMRFTSPLSVGVWGLSCLGIFLGFATIFAWIVYASIGTASLCFYVTQILLRLCMIMALIAAVVVICYKGVAFSCTSQPGVCQARWLPSFMVTDALLMGLGLLGILAIIATPYHTAALLVIPTVVMLVARCIAFALVWQDVKYRARKSYSESRNHFIGIMVYIIGGLLPLVLLFCGSFCFGLAAVLFFCAGLFERNWIIGLARPVTE